MTFERAPYLSYADIPIAYMLELGGNEFLGVRDYNGDFRQIESIREIRETDNQAVEMFGPSLGLLIPCRADILDSAGEPVGYMSIRVVNGHPACTLMAANPNQALTSSLLRQIPLASLVREAAAAQVVRVFKTGEGLVGARYVEGGPGFGDLLEDLRKELAAVDERGRRRVVDEAFLRMVANVYRSGLAIGVPPSKHVENMLGPTTPANARRWVAAARREGFLGPAPTVGRAGELVHVEGVSS